MSDEPDLQSTWLQQTLPKVRQFEQRQHVRFEATRPVELHKATGIRVPCTLIDVSQTGCQLIFETSILIEVGRIYCIKLEGQEMLSASAVWRRERLAGFRFMTKLPSALVKHLASDLPQSAGLPFVLDAFVAVPGGRVHGQDQGSERLAN